MKGLKKANKVLIPIFITLILAVILGIGSMYGLTKFENLPVELPVMETIEYDGTIPYSSEYIMNNWRNFVGYNPPERIDSMDKLIVSGELDNLQEITKEELESIFPVVDQKTLDAYIEEHPECIENGYERLFIDKVDFMNTPTGIKTVLGDDILAIDAINKIVIIGRDVESSTGVSKVKLALIYDKDQVEMSMVRDLSYWNFVEEHAKYNEAILAINASGYIWNETQHYASVYGALKYKDNVIRKPQNTEEIIAFDKAKNLSFGTSIDDAYYAVEYYPILIKEGEIVYKNYSGSIGTGLDVSAEFGEIAGLASTDTENPEEVEEVEEVTLGDNEEVVINDSSYPYSDNVRSATAAIGQTGDGVTMFFVASGGTYNTNMGVTYSEILTILKDYGAYNAAVLSGGARTIMYWNGRVVNETVGYDQQGVRLPNTFYVKYYST